MECGNLLIEVDDKKKKLAENLIKMKTYHNLKCKVWLHEKLTTQKGPAKKQNKTKTEVYPLLHQRKKETTQRKQGVTDNKKLIIEKDGEEIQRHTHILTVNNSVNTKKIECCLERVELYPHTPEML